MHRTSSLPWEFLHTSIQAQDAWVGWWTRKGLESRGALILSLCSAMRPAMRPKGKLLLVSEPVCLSVKNISVALLGIDSAAHIKIEVYFSVI